MRLMLSLTAIVAVLIPLVSRAGEDPTAGLKAEIGTRKLNPGDWPMLGGWTHRNNTPDATNIPETWDVKKGTNILWSTPLGSQTYGNTVVANGKIFVGTNNYHGYLKRYPKNVDLGVLLCLDEKTGKFSWQHSSQKLPTGLVHDWPDQGICCSPFCDGDRVWLVTNRGEVICLDTEGFLDNENDSPFTSEENENKDESDVVWKFDMMGQLGVSQHNMCSCSLTCVGNVLFVCTSNGVDETHVNIPAPKAPSFCAIDRNTGKVLWTDSTPGRNILHGQWSSPAYAEVGGQAQIIFGSGDGWVYSFDPVGDGAGNSKELWRFDCNPKASKYSVSGKSERNHLIGTAVVYDGLVYIGVGEDPEHGEGNGHLWCIDPTKRGDISAEIAVDKDGKEIVDPRDGSRRLQAIFLDQGEKSAPNPNSGAVWHYIGEDTNGNGKLEFEEEMHRTMGTCAVKDDLCYVVDSSGAMHCVDAKTGKSYWNHDMFAASWGSPLIVDGKVYFGDEDGDVSVFKHGKDMEEIAVNSCGNSVYSTPIVANGVLYISNKSTLFAIGHKK